jgi:hypothetical protein
VNARGLLTCWNSDEEGHSANKRPKEKNPEKFKSNKEKFDQAKAQGRGGRGGRGGCGGRGRSGGRGGRGRGTSTTSNKELVDIFKTPPTKKGMVTMNVNGETYYWCHKCQAWNKNHLTSDHSKTTAATATVATPAASTSTTTEAKVATVTG